MTGRKIHSPARVSFVNERFLMHALRDGTYHRAGAVVGDRVRTEEPLVVDFTLDALTQP